MPVTFPHMGNLAIVIKALLTGMGQEVLVPPPVSKHTLALGEAHAPEGACLPLKVTLGSFMESLSAGADTIVTCGGRGPCRLGYYAAVQQEVLWDLGYPCEMVVFEPNLASIYRQIRRLAPRCGVRQVWRVFQLASAKMQALDAIDRQACASRPLLPPGEADRLQAEGETAVDMANTVDAVWDAAHTAVRRMAQLCPPAPPDMLHVGLVGEIYVLLEPFVNHHIAARLGRMGVAVHQEVRLSDYVCGQLFRQRSYQEGLRRVIAAAAPYLNYFVGGHGQKTVGHAALLGAARCDGVIQVYPFSCMPEIVAKSVLGDVGRDYRLPVLSLPFDQHAGEAGLITRLEAFVDLLRYRRRRFRQSTNASSLV